MIGGGLPDVRAPMALADSCEFVIPRIFPKKFDVDRVSQTSTWAVFPLYG